MISLKKWTGKEGSPEKILLHGLIAGLMAEINGGKFGEGLTNGAINEMVIGLIADHQKELGLTGADTRWISALIGGVISEGLGGSFGQGAGIADSATKNNYLTHKQQADWHNAISLCETTECKDELTAYYNELDSRQTEWLISRLGLSEKDAQELRDKKGVGGSTFLDNLLEQEITHPSDLKIPDKVKEYQNNASEIGNGNKGPINDIKIPPTDKENWYMNDSDKTGLYEKMLQDPTFMPDGIDEQYRYVVQKQLEAAIIAEETDGRVFIIYDKELTANELAYHRAITAMDASENGWLTSQHNAELTNAVGFVLIIGELPMLFESIEQYQRYKNSANVIKTLGPDTKVVVTPEVKASTMVNSNDVVKNWETYLGPNQTNINPRTGLPDPDRLFSADGTRSIRLGSHEMTSLGTPKGHYHLETWSFDPLTDTITVTNILQRIKP